MILIFTKVNKNEITYYVNSNPKFRFIKTV